MENKVNGGILIPTFTDRISVRILILDKLENKVNGGILIPEF